MPQVADIEQNMKRCLCGTCPSFPGDAGFFCAKGRSGNAVERKGCNCGECPNFTEFGLSKGYYCADGSAQQIEA